MTDAVNPPIPNVSLLLSGVRRGIEDSSRLRRDAPDLWRSLILKIEAIRIEYNASRRMGTRRYDSILAATSDAREKLSDLLSDDEFLKVGGGLRYRPMISPLSDRENLPAYLLDRDIDLVEAVARIIGYIDSLAPRDLFGVTKDETNILRLRQVLPEQKLAPVMFDIVNGKIVVIHQNNKPLADDSENVDKARGSLVERGKGIIEALEKSNCDRRILENMRDLQIELERKDNIIELGLMNLAVERVCKGAAAELPDALLGAIEGQTAGIGMYVAQFPAWQRFSENAASVELDHSDIERIGQAAQAAIDQITAHPEVVSEEVPKTLIALRALIANPKLSGKRAAFAVLRTIENLAAKIYQYGADFLDKTIKKTVDGLSVAASKIIIGSLLAIALAATANLTGVTAKVAETAWMKTAAEIVMKQLSEVGGK